MRTITSTVLIILIALPATATPTIIVNRMDSELESFRIVRVASGINHPWSIAFLPDSTALISERSGGLLRLDLHSGKLQNLSGAPRVTVIGQGGLLDIEPHPRFLDNRLIYLSYVTGRSGAYTTGIVRGRLTDSGLTDLEEIFTMNRPSGGRVHFGARLMF